MNELTGRLLGGLSAEVAVNRPDAVVVQGDTTTALCGALASFHEAVPVAHVEAGLRTGNRCVPFPEEGEQAAHRTAGDVALRAISLAAANLLGEGLDPSAVIVTGTPSWTASFRSCAKDAARVPLMMMESPAFWSPCTGARHKAPLWRLRLPPWEKRPLDSASLVFPVHPSPTVRASLGPSLADNECVRLVEPLSYGDFVATLANADLVVTDSGGVVEEAVALGVPTLVARIVSERPEAFATGVARRVGTDAELVCQAVQRALSEARGVRRMPPNPNPFGDGRAVIRICDRLLHDLTSSAISAGPTVALAAQTSGAAQRVHPATPASMPAPVSA